MQEVLLTGVRGDTWVKTLDFTQDNSALDITGWTVYFTVKSRPSDADSQSIVRKDITEHTDAAGGQTRLFLTATETNDLNGTYYYDVSVKKADGTIQTIIYGKIIFELDITRRS